LPRIYVSRSLGLDRAKSAKFGLKGGQKADKILTSQFGLPTCSRATFSAALRMSS
jgi:hypothetical protein